MNILYVGQKLERFGSVGAITQSYGTIGAQSLYISELLLENPVEEEQGVEGLVLGRGGNAESGVVKCASFLVVNGLHAECSCLDQRTAVSVLGKRVERPECLEVDIS